MIETQRLQLYPLSYAQLLKYLNLDPSLEEELNTKPTSKVISAELKEALETTILPNVKNPMKNYLYSTLWTGIQREKRIIVGDICIIDYSEKNTLEIGYGTYQHFQNQGYMTEMVKGLIEWIKTQKIINRVIASTEIENLASQKVLEKNHFRSIENSDTLIHWELCV